jgi:hexosaminidase
MMLQLKMKKILSLGLFCLFTFASAQVPTLIPAPATMTTGNGSFAIQENTSIVYQGNAAAPLAQWLSKALRPATGFQLSVKAGGLQTGSISLSTQPGLPDEGYELNVTPQSVDIKASKPAGWFYGIQTLLQLLPPAIESKNPVKNQWMLPAVSIRDNPRFGWRGLMLDVSRHFFTKEEVKSYIDLMARYKLNVFHWHLTDDNGWRIEIKQYPKLTSIGAWRVERYGLFNNRKPPQEGEATPYGGFYTQQDIREIVAYAQERFVTIVPEVDIPGHSMAILAAYPELSCTKTPDRKVNPGTRFSEWYGNGKFKMLIDNTLNPSDEKVYQFLDGVFTEIAALFPGTYIHMGGDECYKGYWEQDPACQALMKKEKLKSLEELQSYFVKRVEKIIRSKGKKLMGWDEILEGGLAPGAAVMNWRGIEHAKEATHLKHPLVLSPTSYFYIDYMQGDPALEIPIYSTCLLSTTYAFDPQPEGVDHQFILGGQANLWSEKVPTIRHAQYMTYPRAFAVAEVFWSPKEKRNWSDFARRVQAHFERLDVAEVKYSRSMLEPKLRPKQENGKLILEMYTEVEGLNLHYTLDHSFPDAYSPRYTQAIMLPEDTDLVRVVAYQDGKPTGRTLSISIKDLQKRAGIKNP